MGITRADLVKELIPGLNTLFGIGAEYNKAMDWLTTNHPQIVRQYTAWLLRRDSYSSVGMNALRIWLTHNHPELIPIIDLITQE